MTAEKFFIKRGDKVQGPFEIAFLLNVAKQGKLLSSDEIGPTDNGPWEPVSSNEELTLAIQSEPTKRKKSLKVKNYKVITKKAAEGIYEIEYTCAKCYDVITISEEEAKASFLCPGCNVRSKVVPEALDEISSHRNAIIEAEKSEQESTVSFSEAVVENEKFESLGQDVTRDNKEGREQEAFNSDIRETNDLKEKAFDVKPEQPDAINAHERIKQLEEQVQLLLKANSEKTTSSPRDIKNFQEQTAKKLRDDTALADASAVDGCEQNEMSRKIPIRDLPKTLFELYMARGLLLFLGLAATSAFTFLNGNTDYLFLSTVFMVGLVWKWSDGNLSEDATNYFASKEKIVSVLIFFVLIATHVGVGSTPKAFSQGIADRLYEFDQLKSRLADEGQTAQRRADKATQDEFEQNLDNAFKVFLAAINMGAVTIWIKRRNKEWKYIEEVTGKTSL